jgi:hypothetical protein
MNPVNLRLPSGCEVYNYLYRTRDPGYLVQDQLSVALPNGYYIDVAWTPEHDPTGEYVVRVFYEYWNDQQINPIRLGDVDQVIQTVEYLAHRFSQPQIITSSSEETRHEVIV